MDESNGSYLRRFMSRGASKLSEATDGWTRDGEVEEDEVEEGGEKALFEEERMVGAVVSGSVLLDLFCGGLPFGVMKRGVSVN